MAGKDDGDAVAVHHGAHRSSGARAADALRERAVRGRLPVGHARELVEDRDREGRQLAQIEREVERAARPAKYSSSSLRAASTLRGERRTRGPAMRASRSRRSLGSGSNEIAARPRSVAATRSSPIGESTTS